MVIEECDLNVWLFGFCTLLCFIMYLYCLLKGNSRKDEYLFVQGYGIGRKLRTILFRVRTKTINTKMGHHTILCVPRYCSAI